MKEGEVKEGEVYDGEVKEAVSEKVNKTAKNLSGQILISWKILVRNNV